MEPSQFDGVDAPNQGMAIIDDENRSAARASLMGLPTELRLEIYSHLLPKPMTDVPPHASTPLPPNTEPRSTTTHCCGHLRSEVLEEQRFYERVNAREREEAPWEEEDVGAPRNDDGDEGIYTKSPRAKCTCYSGAHHTQILATCSTIFKEAMPLFYNSLELRILLPTAYSEVPHFDACLLPQLPIYARTHIKRLVLVCDGSDSVIDDETEPWFMDHFWTVIRDIFPGIQSTRLHIDQGILLDPARQALSGALRFKSLERFIIELHIARSFVKPEGWLSTSAQAWVKRQEAVGDTIRTNLIEAAARLRKQLKVETTRLYSDAGLLEGD